MPEAVGSAEVGSNALGTADINEGDLFNDDSLAANDDIQNGVIRDSRITITLPAGSYLVRATTWGPAERGTYNLAIRGCRVGDPTTPPPGRSGRA